MPVSKKPRRAKKTRTNPRPILPNPQVMENLLAAITGQTGDDPISRAQDVMYEAWEQTDPKTRIALAHKALEISPLCADAYVLLAQQYASSAQAVELYTQAVDAAERAIGPEAFEEYRGHFWGFLETRPYMRARAGLAGVLLARGETEAAIGHFRALLQLNPNDNQGLRYTLLGCLLRDYDPAPVNDLIQAYAEDWSAFWLYTRLLMAYRSGRHDDKETATLIKDALSSNRFVPLLLTNARRPPLLNAGYITVGGIDEASEYVLHCADAWRRTPGALDWLATATGTARPQRSPGRLK